MNETPPQGPLDSTLELLERVRQGDAEALERLVGRYLQPLRRWASGRLPRQARSLVNTEDLVQDTLLRTLGRVSEFEPRGPGAFQAYLRRALLNRIRDEVRSSRRAPDPATLDEEERDRGPSPLEEAVGEQAFRRYEAALERLRVEDRGAIVARVEMGLSWREVSEALGKPSIEAAQMAVSRALVRLAKELGHERGDRR
jgi:RNA polymerase sigma-70 factor (ECF subfamily)